MKVLVCGGRYFNNKKLLYKCLDAAHNKYKFTCLVHGDAQGADSLAGEWANDNAIQIKAYPADWKRYKNAAGPIRNKLMLDDNSDISLVIAFPGGTGTSNMISLARKAKIKVIDV